MVLTLIPWLEIFTFIHAGVLVWLRVGVGVRERERVCVSRCWIRSNEFPLKFQQHQSVTIVLNAEVRCNYIKNVIRACRMWNNDSYFPNLPLARVDDDTEIFSVRFSTISKRQHHRHHQQRHDAAAAAENSILDLNARLENEMADLGRFGNNVGSSFLRWLASERLTTRLPHRPLA